MSTGAWILIGLVIVASAAGPYLLLAMFRRAGRRTGGGGGGSGVSRARPDGPRKTPAHYDGHGGSGGAM